MGVCELGWLKELGFSCKRLGSLNQWGPPEEVVCVPHDGYDINTM